MKGTEWMKKVIGGEISRSMIPLEFTMGIPLPAGEKEPEVQCFHYCLRPAAEPGKLVLAPSVLITRWNAEGDRLLEQRRAKVPQEQTVPAEPFLKNGPKEQEYLDGPFQQWLCGKEQNREKLRKAWEAAIPEPLMILLKEGKAFS